MTRGSRAASTRPPARQSRKPRALKVGSVLAVFGPASPADAQNTEAGMRELSRLGFASASWNASAPDSYFAAPAGKRRAEFLSRLADPAVQGLIALRGGYGSNYLLEDLSSKKLGPPKCVVGFSDITSLQIFLWERCRWVSFYGPMVAAGLAFGAGAAGGYDEASFRRAVTETRSGWSLDLQGETIVAGKAEGRVLGGCLTLLETAIGTPWEPNTHGAILILEDRGMKPWQVDRALMHLRQAGKLEHVRGIVLGDFPECEPPVAGSWSVAGVCRRILGSLGVPVVWGAPIGHTPRPILTIPLGVKARLNARGAGLLEFLEPAVVE